MESYSTFVSGSQYELCVAQTIATISPERTLLKYAVPSACLWPNLSKKSGMARKPLI
jgi:hypothetical protein